ncbi:MAG: hypothetical protein GX605_11775 [Chloroflexi bacterium]|nr:hypothetical protein [Chloroflexota bacterium]
MARYTGKDMVVELSGAGALLNVQAVDINPEGGGVERLEGTAAGDTAKQYRDAIPDTPRMVVEISALDESGASTIYKTLAGAAFTADTLTFYPEGKAGGKPKATAAGYVLRPVFGHGYGGMNTVKVTFQCAKSASYKLAWSTQ